MRRPLVLSVLSAVIAVGNAGAQEPVGPISVLDSVYTVEQAARGDELFVRVCLDCHLPEEFSKGGYMNSWAGQSVADLLEYIQFNMPEDNPGTLSDVQNFEVMAYILSLNGIPAGPRELTAATVTARIELP